MLSNGPYQSLPTKREGPLPFSKSIGVLRATVRGERRTGLRAPLAILETDRVS
jgi:hypothetical protein